MDRRTFLISAAAAALLPGPALCGSRDIRIGLLLPLTGADAARGRMARNAALLAVDELNRRAGRNGRFIAALVEDTRSDPRRFRDALRRFTYHDRVVSVFGLCPDGARPDMLRFLERTRGLFWDPAPYGGGECSKNLIHGGATPHQSLKHLVPWLTEQVGDRLLLVGGQGAYGRELLRVARITLDQVGGRVVATVPDAAAAVQAVGGGGIDAVLSTLEGEPAAALLRAWRAAGIDPRRVPIASPTLTEIEVALAGPGKAAGAIAVQPWFASWVSPESWRFLDRMRRRHGGRVAATSLAEAMWSQIHLFSEALTQLAEGDVHPLNIREAAKEREIAAPQGKVRVERDSLHTVLWPKIAVAEPSGRFKVLARSRDGVPSLPFWANPGKACTDAGLRYVAAEKRRSRVKTLLGGSE